MVVQQLTLILILISSINLLGCSAKPAGLINQTKLIANNMVSGEISLNHVVTILNGKLLPAKESKKIEIGSEKYTELMQLWNIEAKNFYATAFTREDGKQSVYRLEITPKDNLEIFFKEQVEPILGQNKWKLIHKSKTSSVVYYFPSAKDKKVDVFVSMGFPPQNPHSRVLKIVIQKKLEKPSRT